MPKILFDYQAFWMQRYGGISEYFYNVVSRLKRAPRCDASFAVRWSNNPLAAELTGAEPYLYLPLVFPWRGMGRVDQTLRRFRILPDREGQNKSEVAASLRKRDFDIFHPTYYDDYFAGELGDRPYVITVHDMIHDLMPEYFPNAAEFIKLKKRVVARANRIIAVSQSTKNDLTRLYGVPADRVVVSHLGRPADSDEKPKNAERPDHEFILFVGHRSAYKNFRFFLISIAERLRRNKKIHLLCAGSAPLTAAERSLIKSLGLTDQVKHRPVNHEREFRTLYEQALVFAFPSKYEGFGLPLLAALSYGCPVVCAGTGSFPEIAGRAAVYFDPDNESEIADAVFSFVESPDLRRKHRELGRERSPMFSWDRCADRHLEVYNDMIR